MMHAQHSRQRIARPPYVTSLDGLRAFAVIAVVLYHLRTEWAPCGLLGVTMFFVLSGYLITGLLINEWRRSGGIDLRTFWVKRIRRIMPAIGFLLLCLVVLCGIFSPVMLTKLRKDFLSSLFFYNNWWQIFQDVSYFENLGSPSPTTHLWSLAIEEQFYIVWPLVLLFLWKIHVNKKGIRGFILIFALASAVEMALLYAPDADPSRVYYGTDTRAFSLLIGAWLAFAFPVGKIRSRSFQEKFAYPSEIAGWVSLGAILVMVFTVSAFEPFLYRGGFFLVSVLTAVAIVALVRERGILSRIFSCAFFAWLGKRSYGLYLWHYPLLLLMNPQTGFGETPWWGYVLQVAVIIAVTEFSYHFIEEPIRHGAIGNAFWLVRSRRETPERLVRTHAGYFGGALALLVAATVFWVIVPPAQVIANTEIVEGNVVDPKAVIAQQKKEEGESADDSANSNATPSDTDAKLASLPKNAWQWNLLLIGDSVSASAVPEFEDYFVRGAIDARSNRNLLGGQNVLKTWVDEGWDGDAVVIALGANTAADEEEFRKEYEELIDIVPEGIPIFVVNNRTPGIKNYPNNDVIEEIAQERDNVYLIDWYNESANHSEWFYSDGTHLREDGGTKGYIEIIAKNLERIRNKAAGETGSSSSESTNPTNATPTNDNVGNP